jgi:hypothetical protein
MRNGAVPLGAILLILGSASGAHAYIDPGSGSMLLQLLLGGVAGLLVLAKLYWQRLLRLFGVGHREPGGLTGDGAATEGKIDSGSAPR